MWLFLKDTVFSWDACTWFQNKKISSGGYFRHFFFLCHDIELVLVLRWKDALKKAKIRSFSHLHTCGFLLVQDCLSKLGLGSFLLVIFGGVFWVVDNLLMTKSFPRVLLTSGKPKWQKVSFAIWSLKMCNAWYPVCALRRGVTLFWGFVSLEWENLGLFTLH